MSPEIVLAPQHASESTPAVVADQPDTKYPFLVSVVIPAYNEGHGIARHSRRCVNICLMPSCWLLMMRRAMIRRNRLDPSGRACCAIR